MCFPKVPNPPPPPPPPSRTAADDAADELRRKLAARQGYASTIRTSGTGVTDYGQNSHSPQAGGPTSPVLGM